MSEKRIHRARHDKENPYYIASRDTAQDKTLSYDALGMLNYILSKPDDWDIQPDDLRRKKCEIKKVYSILKELINATYVERIYHRDEKKRIKMVEYVAHEKPLSQNLQVEKLQVEKGNRNTVYRSSQNTENTQKREKSTNAQSQSPNTSKTAQHGRSAIKEVSRIETKKRSEKSPKTVKGWLTRLSPVRVEVVEMLKVCYDGWDNAMMTPDNSLTVHQLENYITNTEEYIRLGGKANEVGQVYEYVADLVDYTIAPKTIAGYYLRWKASKKAEDSAKVDKAYESAKAHVETLMTDEQRKKRAEQMKADRIAIFGEKTA